jgi:APA family basic amino acid/polyamine antiporter
MSEKVIIGSQLPGDKTLRRKRRKIHRLRRVLGVAGLFSSAYGNVGSSIYYALGVTALYALGLTPLVFMFSGLIFACTAMSYAEGTAAIPEAGGSSSFARRGFNELISFTSGWALTLGYVVTIGISAFEVPNYLAVFWPVLKTWPTNSIGGIVIIASLAAVNVVGIKESAWLNIALAVLDLATQVFVATVGLILLFDPQVLLSNVKWGVAPTWSQLVYGVSISMIAYTGIETISNLAEEARTPDKTIPRAVGLVVLAVLIIYAPISTVALSAMPVYQAAGGSWVTDLALEWRADPVMGLVHHMPQVLRTTMGVWVGILAATILTIATNAGIMGLSRLTYSMGQHWQIPPLISKIHPKFRTPYRAIVIFSIAAALLIIPGQVDFLADIYAFGAMMAFTFAHVSIIALRLREPDLPRPFRAPLNVPFRDATIPLTAVIGGLATASVWFVVVFSQFWTRIVGLSWVVVGYLIYYFYRRAKRLPLWDTVRASASK